MLQICSVCKVVYGEKEPLDDQRLTHGYCLECYKAVMAEIDDTPNLTAIAAESSGVSKINHATQPNPGTAKRYATDIRGVAAVGKVTGT